jgi:hypothetical protein
MRHLPCVCRSGRLSLGPSLAKLGDPDGQGFDYPLALKNSEPLAAPRQIVHPLKGPMVTQSLRGLADSAPFHWRGDRFGHPATPGSDVPSFKEFNAAFVDLLGREEEITDSAMEAFTRFVLTIRYPPNPNQRLDRSMDREQQAGFDFFTGPFRSGSGLVNCVNCHILPLGTNRRINFEDIRVGRDMKTAHLRNVYQKVGRFNVPGPQVSGFGLLHDGTFDTVANFLRLDTFLFPGNTEEEKDVTRRLLQNYVMAFDTGMAAAVGRQLTISDELDPDERRLTNLLMNRAAAGDCDLTGRVGREKRCAVGCTATRHFTATEATNYHCGWKRCSAVTGAAMNPLLSLVYLRVTDCVAPWTVIWTATSTAMNCLPVVIPPTRTACRRQRAAEMTPASCKLVISSSALLWINFSLLAGARVTTPHARPPRSNLDRGKEKLH